MILVYSNKVTERLKFTLGTVLKGIIGVNFEISTNRDQYVTSGLPGINYSYEDLGKGIKIHPFNLLFKSSLEPEIPPFLRWNGVPVLYPQQNTDFPFDIFAASFYMLSRYEEYMPFNADDHDRFPAKESIAYRENFIDIPVVDEWARQLEILLTIKYPEIKLNKRKFSYISTVDIDRFYNQRYNEPSRVLLGSARSLLTGKPLVAIKKFISSLKLTTDPWDIYEYLNRHRLHNNINYIYFIHCGEVSEYDHPIPLYFKEIRDKIRLLAIDNTIGIHPSYTSNYDNKVLRDEKTNLEYFTNYKITRSRQHFLKFMLPVTYQKLYHLGIKEEYSMGFADHYGFRAGTCHPFYFYDLGKELITPLKIHPFMYMDNVLKDTLNLKPNEAKSLVAELIQKVQKVNGNFISIWHNSSLSNWAEWKGWRAVYEEEVRIVKSIIP